MGQDAYYIAGTFARYWFLAVSFAAVLGASNGCDASSPGMPASAPRPDRFLGELPVPGGSEWLHTCGKKLVAVSHEDEVYVWKWADLRSPPAKGKSGGGLATAFLSPDLIVTTRSGLEIEGDAPPPILVIGMDSGSVLQRWAIGRAWYCVGMRSARNGRFVALHAWSQTPPRRIRLGLLEAKSEQPAWVATMTESRGTLRVSHVAPSDDGRYIAAAGIHDGAWIAVADVAAKKLLWGKRQDGAVKFYDVAFSPDAKTVYTGGTSGGLFAYDVATGALTKRYAMGGGLDEQYGYRVTRVAASPDGHLVTAGTGSGGAVHVWRAGTGTRVLSFGTRQATIMGLAFSPDSTRLAVTGVANRTVEIWDVTAGQTAPRLQPSGREDKVARLSGGDHEFRGTQYRFPLPRPGERALDQRPVFGTPAKPRKGERKWYCVPR